jgi:ribonuclease HI
MQNVFTDGACSRNGRRGACASIGVYFGANDMRNVSEPLDDDDCHTNQRAELYALGKAMEILLTRGDTRPTTIYSDSEYAINCLTRWAPNWKRRGWRKADGEEVKNLDIIQPSFEIWQRLEEQGNVSVAHIRREFNGDADALAVAGARLAKVEGSQGWGDGGAGGGEGRDARVVVHKAGYR